VYACVGAGVGNAGVFVGRGTSVNTGAAVSDPDTDGVGNSVVGKLQAKMESNRASKALSREKGWFCLIVILTVIER
jgi:hypothetical protein